MQRVTLPRQVGRSATPLLVVVVAAAISLPLSGPLAGLGAQEGTEARVGGPGSANYELAARWAPYQLEEMIHDTSVEPRWIEGSDRFWYSFDTSEGTFYRIVEPGTGSKREIFDNDRIAAEITRITGDPYDGQHLPIESIRFVDPNTIRFDVTSSKDEEPDEDERVDEDEQEDQEDQEGGREPERPKKKVHHFEYDVESRTLRELEAYEEPDDHPSWASVSPDGSKVVFARDHDLWMMTGEEYEKILDARRGKDGDEAEEAEEEVEVEETRLTEDGVEYYGWEANTSGRGETEKEREENAGDRKRASVLWSKDSNRVAVVRADMREVGELWVIHSVGNERPELERYKYDMPGEEHVTQNELWWVDLVQVEPHLVEHEVWKDENLEVVDDRQFFYPDSEEPRQRVWLSDSPDELWFMRESRDRHKRDLMVADLATGEVRVVIEERMNTSLEDLYNPDPVLLEDGDILWWSERDGWAHVYRFGPDGELRARLTEGPWHVDGIEAVDEDAGVVYLTGNGREEGEDPYYMNLYRVALDGSSVELLTPGDYDHRVSMDESARFFVENRSRVNTVPEAVVRDARGREITHLERADFSRMEEAGWQMPEPFRVKSADGVTDIFGVMYKPFDFDPGKTYPIVAYVYPGPQTEAVSKSFSTTRYETALAQFGFIVVTMGNRGGHPDRSKWYHNYGYGNLRDYGLADKKATIEQLADRHDFIDLERVGIYGHSGGGFMSTAAMLVYPDFFDVAVSSAGNHTNEIYNRWWSETHHGVKEVVDDEGNVTFEYDIDSNPELAENLKGHLLLVTGDQDNNVHHANTLRMAKALIDANKRFDYFVLPGVRHSFQPVSDYWFWLRAEYFVKHLLGDDRWSPDIVQLQGEKPRR